MPTPGPGVHGCFGTNEEWQDAVDEFRIWRRQHVLVSAASLLEVYVKFARAYRGSVGKFYQWPLEGASP